jgi:hypothetical protein
MMRQSTYASPQDGLVIDTHFEPSLVELNCIHLFLERHVPATTPR